LPVPRDYPEPTAQFLTVPFNPSREKYPMQYFLSMLPILITGAIVLMAGILINRGPKQSLGSALNESILWGSSFFLSFSAEILVLVHA
jgi:hypothetical protein